MSKPTPLWQPGDRWQPPIVRVHGVDPETPVGRQLMSAHAGAIRQFYLGQAQAHAQGITPSSRGVKQLPGVSMRYTNVLGQEILDVRFAPEVAEAPPPPEPKTKQRPDWLFAEIVVPNAGGYRPQVAAFLRTPSWESIYYADTVTPLVQNFYPGFYYGTHSWAGASVGAGFPPGAIGFPSPEDVVTHTIPRNSPHRSTFVLDMTKMVGHEVISVDLYGWIEQADADYYAYEIDYYQSSFVDRVLVDSLDESWYEIWETDAGNGGFLHESNKFASGFGNSGVNAAIAADAAAWDAIGDGHSIFDMPSTKSTPDPFLLYDQFRYVDGAFRSELTQYTDGPDFGAPADWWRYDKSRWWDIYEVPYHDVGHLEPILTPRIPELRSTLLVGNPDWRAHRWVHEQEGPFPSKPGLTYMAYTQDFRTWEIGDDPAVEPVKTQSKAPLPQMPTYLFGETPVGVGPPGPENKYWLPLLGTLTVVPGEWSTTWEPA